MKQVSQTKWARIKINKQKSEHKKFHEQSAFHEEKINVKVSRSEKSTYNKFHKQERNQYAQVPRTKLRFNKFHEQIQFQEEENQCTSLTERKINMSQVSGTK